MIKSKAALLVCCLFISAGLCPSLAAQEFAIDPEPLEATQEEGLRELGRTAEIGGTRVGERQETRRVADGILPTVRINSRLPLRLQNRLRTRIDEFYNPAADAAAPFREIEQESERLQDQRPRR